MCIKLLSFRGEDNSRARPGGPHKFQALDVDCHAFNTREAVEESFGYRWVCVDCKHHLLDRRFELDCSDCLGDDLRRIWPNDVHAKNFAVFCISNHLDEAVMRIDNRRLRITDEREFANLYLEAFLFGLRLCQAN